MDYPCLQAQAMKNLVIPEDIQVIGKKKWQGRGGFRMRLYVG